VIAFLQPLAYEALKGHHTTEKSIVSIRSLLGIGFVSLAAWGGMSLVNAQTSPPAQTLPEVPEAIQVPEGQRLLVEARATGVQIYICQASADDSAQYEWTLKGLEAELVNQQGQVIGDHYDGPTWESKDGSKVTAQAAAKVDAPQGDGIPWLLLEAQPQSESGVFSQVAWVQRLNTEGGEAPESGCDQASQNREVRVDYVADYYFYGPATRGS
jgi:hypothetical protein